MNAVLAGASIMHSPVRRNRKKRLNQAKRTSYDQIIQRGSIESTI